MIRRRGPSRRAFLGGASVAIGLPLLESLMPKRARGQSASAPLRFLGYYVPCGMVMEQWTPALTGTDWAPTPLLEPLTPYKANVNVLTGLQNTHQEMGPGDHAGGTGAFLTGRTVPKLQTVHAGPSIDQAIAAVVGQQTTLPSLQIGGEGGDAAGTCDSGYPCAFVNQISFDLQGVPMPKLTDMTAAYNLLFAGSDSGATAAEAARRAALKASALDIVVQQADDLQPKLSAFDRPKMQQYLDSVREVERRIQLVASNPVQCNSAPPPMPQGSDQYIEVMSDLLALAFQCDATRVVSLEWGNAGSNRDYSFVDPSVTAGHHTISHHQGLQVNIDQLVIIDHWEITKLAYLLDKLSKMQDFDGKTVLENSIIFYSSEISDGDRHNHDNMPVLLLGNAGGAITGGRHIMYPN
ncbi:MAG TPA: DUF1552 domain-containing protein, partial [Polyangiaceae bacterium]|nr:DUF1552 domain-containing protein [Polyangiaceae bacterium]